MKREKDLQKIVDFYGADRQVDKSIEEMSELITILLHKRLNRSYLEGRTKIADELADVYNMLDQLKLIYVIDSVVDDRRDFKIDRTLKNINDIEKGLIDNG